MNFLEYREINHGADEIIIHEQEIKKWTCSNSLQTQLLRVEGLSLYSLLNSALWSGKLQWHYKSS